MTIEVDIMKRHVDAATEWGRGEMPEDAVLGYAAGLAAAEFTYMVGSIASLEKHGFPGASAHMAEILERMMAEDT